MVGYKPTHGFIGTAGLKPLSPAQDTVGVLARMVADAAFFAVGLHGAEVTPQPDLRPRLAVCHSSQWDAVRPEMDRISKTLASQVTFEDSEFLWLRTSVLANLLGEFALASADADGWTDLASAAHHCWEVEPKQMAQLKEIYGYARLKQAMLATQLFEFSDTSNQQSGGAKYRVNQHWGGRDQLNILIPPP